MSSSTGGLLDMNEVGFDFSLPFEQLIFSIIPTAIFILSAIARIVLQSRKPTVVHDLNLQLVKAVRRISLNDLLTSFVY
jgi:hypothetical protein